MIQNDLIEPSIAYIHEHWRGFLDEFKQLLCIPSISGDPNYKQDVRRTAEWIRTEMQRVGLHNVHLLEGAGHPAVYGEWLEAGADKPVVLMYAHYDTQPADPVDLWVSPPFEPEERDGWLYARGAVDDKCGVFGHLKVVESCLATQESLPVNVKFIFEGEEESGSPSMEDIIRRNRELLRADLLIVSDGGCVGDQPYVIASTRGIVCAEVSIHGPSHDLHSGRYGGVVCNPAHVAAEIIAAAQGGDGRIQIPGFYDDVLPISAEELDYFAGQEDELVEYARQDTGLDEFWGVDGYSFIERQTVLPTFDINGLYSGYRDAGSKTIIPAKAGFKASMRLAAGQDPQTIVEKVKHFVKNFERPGIHIDVSAQAEGRAVTCLTSGPIIAALQEAYKKTYDRPAILYRQGGSVPVMGELQYQLGVPIVNLGFGNGMNHHAPNERISLNHLQLDIETAVHFYQNLGRIDKADISFIRKTCCDN